MLSTKELEISLKNTINQVIPDLDLKRINFYQGNDSSPEGIYIFSQNGLYHYIVTEKGKVQVAKELHNEKDVLWLILNEILFDSAIEFAIVNKQNGKDFRRKLFKKELELFSLFGDEFRKRKENDIQEILLENPYVDEK